MKNNISNYNKEFTILLARVCGEVIEELMKCAECGHNGWLCMAEADYECEPEFDGACEQGGCQHHEPCLHCADNRKRADELEQMKKELCWHEWGEGLNDGIFSYMECEKCSEKLQPIMSEGRLTFITANPDFTTYEGYGLLISYLKRLGIWEKFKDWLYDNGYKIHTNNDDILTTPKLFMQAVILFLRERKG